MDWGGWALHLLVGALVVAGVLGSFLPFLPGTPLILLGAFIYAVSTDFDPIGPGRLVVLGALTLTAYVLDYLAGAAGAKKYGGSRWAVAGAILGAIVGLFFGFAGVLLGPIVGAIALELVYSKQLERSMRIGFGTIVGMVLGVAVKVSLAVVMAVLFVWWVW